MTPGRDFGWTLLADIRTVNEGESCPTPGCAGKLVVGKAVEVGHIFKLGYKYTSALGATVLDPNGKEVTPIMGCYGIGIERILTAAIELYNDANGFWLPASIAPFTVVVTVTNVTDPLLRETGERIAAELEAAGLSYLGLGARPPAPEWGAMLNDARDYWVAAPWALIFPGIAITTLVLGFNLLGDGLREALSPY